MDPTPQGAMTLTGMPQVPAVMPTAIPAGGPGAGNPFIGNLLAQIAARRAAMQDWRGQRPEHGAGMPAGQFYQQMMDWRGQRPQMQDFRQPGPGFAPGAPMPVGQMDFSKFGQRGGRGAGGQNNEY